MDQNVTNEKQNHPPCDCIYISHYCDINRGTTVIKDNGQGH